jgi:murein DD-endopeptidase MepM/ murein hydrolase activator NlpD
VSPAARRARWLVAASATLVALGAAGAARAAEAPAEGPRVHVVRSGDTLGAIARRYGVTVAALVTANRLASDRVRLRIGQALVVPPAVAGPPPLLRPRAALAVRTPGGGRGPRGLALVVPDWVETSPAFAWPVEGPVTSAFGRRRAGWHRGIDIKAEPGSAIVAAAAGVVLVADAEPRYGRVVKIEHADGFVTVYAHNAENLVRAGDRVEPGEPIATVGRTGRATTDHLHFEVRRDGIAYNPLYLLPLPPRVLQFEEDEQAGEEHD